MANSVIQEHAAAPDWPLGFVAVPTIGTPVNIMANVDPANNNAPWVPTGPGTPIQGVEYTPACHKVTFQGVKPANNNNGMINNSGQIYILRMPANNTGNFGGPGNRSDPGAMVYVLQSGGSVTIPADEWDGAPISPYRYGIDADFNGDGALVTLLGMR
jgi:hypothetical protein